ncbi:hypothetical protein FACS189459_2540 [Bacilli bacterium]|nr:hypothetical protein FACS189459_2540 [Bacilli bacterium]
MKKRILKLKEKIKAKKDSKRIPRPVEKQIQLGEPIITVNNLIKDFKTSRGTVHALKGITFDIYSGQNIGFVGGNGAGKTTTVEILLGLNKPTSGSINFL